MLLLLKELKGVSQLSVKILVMPGKAYKSHSLKLFGFVTKNSKVSKSKAIIREFFSSQTKTTQGQQVIKLWQSSVPMICLL
jgi:hypothetical protein